MSNELRAMLIRQEGLRLKPYVDSVGKTSIGVGRNLTDNGILESEAYAMLDNDIAMHTAEAVKLPVFANLDSVRQDVLIDMVFNMGLPRVLGFKHMLAALAAKDWDGAADQMLESKWATQVGNRARELAQMVRTGTYV